MYHIFTLHTFFKIGSKHQFAMPWKLFSILISIPSCSYTHQIYNLSSFHVILYFSMKWIPYSALKVKPWISSICTTFSVEYTPMHIHFPLRQSSYRMKAPCFTLSVICPSSQERALHCITSVAHRFTFTCKVLLTKVRTLRSATPAIVHKTLWSFSPPHHFHLSFNYK